MDDLRRIVEHGDQRPRKQQHDGSEDNGDANPQHYGSARALMRALNLLCPHILTYKGGCCNGNALHGQCDELVYFAVGAPSSHTT